jgi:hypothetical protein
LVVVGAEHNQTVLLAGQVAVAVAGQLQHIQVAQAQQVKVSLAAMAQVVMLVLVVVVEQAVWAEQVLQHRVVQVV